MTDPTPPPGGDQGAGPFGAPPPQPGQPWGQPPAQPPGQQPPMGQPWGQPPAGPGWGQQPPAARPTNGLAIAALVLGILAILSAITVLGAPVAIVLGIPAVVLGIMGRRRAGQIGTGGGMAVGGIVTGVLGLLIGLFITVVFALFIQRADTEGFLEEFQRELERLEQEGGFDFEPETER
jgi:hypothetical protein